jgi:hypothetical protein
MAEVIISDANYTQFLDPVVDGETKARGLRPRNFSTHPVGCYSFARPFDLPLIPESEWQDRLDAIIAAKAQLSDVRNRGNNGQPIPSRDQNGKGYCATADTEVLTERGWVPYPDYDWRSPLGTVNPVTHALEFQTPFERHVYEYDGPMVYSTNRRLDFGVTPDHQMYVRKWDEAARSLSPHYSFVRAGDLGWYCGLLPSPSGQIGTELVEVEIPGDRRYDGDDFLALLGLVVSDGYAGGAEDTRNWVSFASFRAEARPAVAALAARLGFRESPSRPGVFTRYDAGALAAWLRANAYAGGKTGARAKRVPLLAKCASVRQIDHFLRWFDDRNRDGSQFYSVSRGLTDDLQELHLRAGRRSAIGSRPAKDVPFNGKTIHSDEAYVLTVAGTERLCLDRKKHLETDRYKGLVYCAAVPNHTLVTRRNGSVLISSNCWAHSSVSAMLIRRAADGEPYADLSAYAVACIIKGYRDEGGWGAESLEWIAQHGVPTAKTWPQQSMSRSNDNAAMRAEAALHKYTDWRDIDPGNMKAQLVTCLLLGMPVVSDFNWWSHSVCTIDLVSLNPFRTRIWNSWGDSWSENGTGILEGNKAVPDGALVAITATPSQA